MKNICVLCMSMFSMQLCADDLPVPYFTNPQSILTKSGHIKLIWRTDADVQYQYHLQTASQKDFKNSSTIYRGPDQATFISGLKNGSYYYRVRAIDPNDQGKESAWSSTIEVTVDHHSLTLAFALAGLGALVFIMTTVVLITGINKDEA